jgi:hypothetical protein
MRGSMRLASLNCCLIKTYRLASRATSGMSSPPKIGPSGAGARGTVSTGDVNKLRCLRSFSFLCVYFLLLNAHRVSSLGDGPTTSLVFLLEPFTHDE